MQRSYLAVEHKPYATPSYPLRNRATCCDGMLTRIAPMVHTQIQSTTLSSKAAYQLEVALEEAIVNVIQHAYPQAQGTIALSVHFSPQEKIEFTLVDQGLPFNPLNTPHVHPDLEEEVPIGGLGIPFLTSFVDHAHYERIEPSNILRLVKHFQQST